MGTNFALLLDDHSMFRAGLRLVLNAEIPDLEIFEAGSLEEAMLCTSNHVKVVLLDIKLNGLSGMEGIVLLKKRWPSTRILMISSFSEPEVVRQALMRGASGFVSKGETVEKIIEAIHRVLRNDDCFPVSVGHPETGKRLTPRQCEVLDLLNQGLSSKLIARKLSISDNTVRKHVQDVLEFFGVASRAEAVFVARNQGLVG